MEKSIISSSYACLLECLKESRRQAGLTQVELAERLGESQSFVSKCERGERRIDFIELREFCKAMNTNLANFIRQFESGLTEKSH